jgi:CheY-like chemotaxis protein
MKLAQITPGMLVEAVRTYLAIAYPDGEPPQRIRDVATVDGDAPLDAALERECVERRAVPDRPDLVGKYLWRLGNARYPQMKLGLERCSDGDDFVFVVDTHDRDLPADSDVYASPEYQDLVRHNAELKHLIETRFHLAGLPTQRGHIAQYLRERCALPSGRRRTVLIVDDDESILELEQALIEEAGYRCLACTCGHDALARLRDSGPIDLCLLDIMMPLLDGHQAAVQLRRQAAARFPIVYVTALPRDRAMDDRADGYIGKPFAPDHLLAVIRRYVG